MQLRQRSKCPSASMCWVTISSVLQKCFRGLSESHTPRCTGKVCMRIGVQAHEAAIRSMQYSHNGRFLLSTDDGGQVKYWKPNLELVKVRGFSRGLGLLLGLALQAHHALHGR